jgi:hypothetical protein
MPLPTIQGAVTFDGVAQRKIMLFFYDKRRTNFCLKHIQLLIHNMLK